MKKKNDPRHIKRIKLIQQLFSWQFRTGKKAHGEIAVIVDNLAQIDKLISEGAPDRPIEEINRIDLSILRLAVFELIIEKDTPAKVIIDEAVELGKEYGSDSSSAFVNGALGKIIELGKIQV